MDQTEIPQSLQPQLKSFLRLALAEHAFLEADAMVEHLLIEDISPFSHLYHACIAAIVSSYCRPFMEATGLGPLPSKFKAFNDHNNSELLNVTHEQLFTARNKLFAHFDLQYGDSEHRESRYALHPGEVVLSLEREGYTIQTNVTIFPPERVADTKELLKYQIERVKKDQSQFVISLLKETQRPGLYVFKIPDGG